MVYLFPHLYLSSFFFSEWYLQIEEDVIYIYNAIQSYDCWSFCCHTFKQNWFLSCSFCVSCFCMYVCVSECPPPHSSQIFLPHKSEQKLVMQVPPDLVFPFFFLLRSYTEHCSVSSPKYLFHPPLHIQHVFASCCYFFLSFSFHLPPGLVGLPRPVSHCSLVTEREWEPRSFWFRWRSESPAKTTKQAPPVTRFFLLHIPIVFPSFNPYSELSSCPILYNSPRNNNQSLINTSHFHQVGAICRSSSSLALSDWVTSQGCVWGGQSFNWETNILSLSLLLSLHTETVAKKNKQNKQNLIIHQSLTIPSPPFCCYYCIYKYISNDFACYFSSPIFTQ